jgi:hypothetical protein
VRIDKGSMKPLSATLLGSFGMKSIFWSGYLRSGVGH